MTAIRPDTVGKPLAAGRSDAAPSPSYQHQRRTLSFARSGTLAYSPSPAAVGMGGKKPNAVCNTRFTPLTWIPKSLWQQFHRSANVFFLGVSIAVIIEPVIAWTTCILFFAGVLLWTALKDLYEDHRRQRDDDAENCRRCSKYDPKLNAFREVQWQEVLVGDLLLTLQDEALPADVMVVKASDEQAFISTVNLDGETNLKERNAARLFSIAVRTETSANAAAANQDGGAVPDGSGVPTGLLREASRHAATMFQHDLEVRLDEPQAALGEFGGTVSFLHPSEELAKALAAAKVNECDLTQDNLVPRGCLLRNTGYMLSIVAYVGGETKTRLNAAEPEAKQSKMQKYLNRGVKGLVAILFTFILYATTSAEIQGFDGEPETYSSTRIVSDSWSPLSVRRALWYWVLMYQIIPISLYVLFEVMKLILGYQIGTDAQMKDPRTGKLALARTADLVEEMGQVNFIFSDKTGTLTENEMLFARCCVRDEDLGDFILKKGSESAAPAPGVQSVKQILDASSMEDERREEVRWLFLCMATCHSCQVDTDQDGVLHFAGSSPDEVAFLEAAQAVGVANTDRRRNSVELSTDLTVEVTGEGKHIISILAEIPFNADRKRMSVLCRFQGKIFCICKGADNVMGSLCDQPFSGKSQEYLTQYSKLGLRTLAFASRTVPDAEYEAWHKKWLAAMVDKQDKQAAMATAAADMERSLSLCGITAIEDKLQEGVPEAIVTLKGATIRFWVLTGDKTETAVEIVHACRVFTEKTTLAYGVNVESMEQCKSKLEAAIASLKDADEGGLVLDGTFVRFALESDELRRKLYELALATTSCVCCRLSPWQKRRLVELVKEQNTQGITLAIGDGANDVSMIQGAHVGIGIRGKEGNSAVQASDVAISQFRFLVPLLQCHGRRAYRRMAVFLQYVIYKHIAIAAGDMIWAHQSRFRGDAAYPEWLNAAYAGAITPFAFFVALGFDSDLPDEVAVASPLLYTEGLRNQYFNAPVFVWWMLSALLHGAVAWLVPSLAVGSDDVEDERFWIASTTSFVILVTVVNCRLWIMSLNPFSFRTVAVMSLSFFIALCSIFLLSGTAIGNTMQPDMEGIAAKTFSQGGSLAVMAITSLAVVSLDLVLIQGRRLLRPSLLDEARSGTRPWSEAALVCFCIHCQRRLAAIRCRTKRADSVSS